MTEIVDHRATSDQEYVDVVCNWADHLHRIPLGADIPRVLCEECGHVVVSGDRNSWSERARSGYGHLESLFQFKRDIATFNERMQQDVTPIVTMPATWFQHLKFSLRSRWPRAFGWLTVRWSNGVKP